MSNDTLSNGAPAPKLALPRGLRDRGGAQTTGDIRQLAAQARAAGAGLAVGGRQTVELFAGGHTDDEIGRAFADPARAAERPAVVAELDAAAADYTDALLRSSRFARSHGSSLSAPGAFPDRDGPIAEVYFTGSDQPADTTWTVLFDVRDYRNTTEEDFEIANVEDAVSFRTHADGERVELYGVSGNVEKYPFALLGGGFQFLRTWIQDNKFWRVGDGLRAMQTGYAVDMARLAYAVLTNPTGLTVQARDADGNSVVENDVNTVNAAATAILADVYNADGHLAPNPSFFLVYNSLTPGYADRVAAMMAANYGLANAALGAAKLTYPVQMVGSPHVPSGALYLVMPGRKLKTGVRMDLTNFERFDPTNFSEGRIGWGRYVHVRGSAKQVRPIPLA